MGHRIPLPTILEPNVVPPSGSHPLTDRSQIGETHIEIGVVDTTVDL
jgi:hypothetical protein